MQTWEYHVLEVTSTAQLQAQLATLGADGWELAVSLPSTGANYERLILRRPLA